MVVLAVEKPLAAGPATIHITYTGILNSEMRGLYLGKDDQGRKYAASQFEATDARRAFPSFDEPDYKATFDITAVADKGQVAISNYKVVSDTPGPGDKHTVKFATTAKMSSYLAALVVGNFEYIEGSVDGIPIRVYSTPGKKEMGKFALEAAEYIVGYYRQVFRDQVSLREAGPDRAAGFLRGRHGEHRLHHLPRSAFADRRKTGIGRSQEDDRHPSRLTRLPTCGSATWSR